MKDAIIITGAGRRVGYVLAQHFAKKGENVVISYRHTYHQLTQLPKDVLQLQADFSELHNIERFVSQIKTHCESVKPLFIMPLLGKRSKTQIFCKIAGYFKL